MIRRHQHHFGTPSEPVFNVNLHSLNDEALKEWFDILLNENDDRIMKATSKQGYFKTGNAAEFVFNTCEKLRILPEARYLAVELFDKFMIQHIYDLYSHVQNVGGDHKKRDWLGIVGRVSNQIVLRVITCCQVASKLTSHYKIVTPRKAWNTLNEFGHKYNTDSILQSELRVIKTLHYKVMLTTPLDYVEILLVLLGNRNEDFPIKRYYNICMKVLDVVYMKRIEVFDALFHTVHGHQRKTLNDIEKFNSVEHDFLLLGTAVVSSAVYIADQPSTDKVIEALSSTAKIHCNDIIDFATVIIKILVKDHEQ